MSEKLMGEIAKFFSGGKSGPKALLMAYAKFGKDAVNRFFKSNIPGRTSKKGKPQKYMYTKESFPKDDSVDATDYIEFRDSAFEEHSPRNLKRLKQINGFNFFDENF